MTERMLDEIGKAQQELRALPKKAPQKKRKALMARWSRFERLAREMHLEWMEAAVHAREAQIEQLSAQLEAKQALSEWYRLGMTDALKREAWLLGEPPLDV